jgi:hypothetical protein
LFQPQALAPGVLRKAVSTARSSSVNAEKSSAACCDLSSVHNVENRNIVASSIITDFSFGNRLRA